MTNVSFSKRALGLAADRPAPSSPSRSAWRPAPPPPPPTTGTASRSARAAATGPSTPATATTAACSSRRAPGPPTAAPAPPHSASKDEQIRVAENTLARQGPGAWPTCGQYLTVAAARARPGTRTRTDRRARPGPRRRRPVPAEWRVAAAGYVDQALQVAGDTAAQHGYADQFQQLLDQHGSTIADVKAALTN